VKAARKKESGIKKAKAMALAKSEAGFKRAAKKRGTERKKKYKAARDKKYSEGVRMDKERRAKLKKEKEIQTKEKKYKAEMPERDHKERKQKRKPGCAKYRGNAQKGCNKVSDSGYNQCVEILNKVKIKRTKKKKSKNPSPIIHHLFSKKKKVKKAVKKKLPAKAVVDLVKDGMKRINGPTLTETGEPLASLGKHGNVHVELPEGERMKVSQEEHTALIPKHSAPAKDPTGPKSNWNPKPAASTIRELRPPQEMRDPTAKKHSRYETTSSTSTSMAQESHEDHSITFPEMEKKWKYTPGTSDDQ
jgi:hypothetical protein